MMQYITLYVPQDPNIMQYMTFHVPQVPNNAVRNITCTIGF
jgi:hypothetical protein